ncbi:MAG: hypothetical protein ACUVQ0_06975 [Thermoproteota archaeon]
MKMDSLNPGSLNKCPYGILAQNASNLLTINAFRMPENTQIRFLRIGANKL